MESSLQKDLAKQIVDELFRRIREGVARAWRLVLAVLLFLGTVASIASLILSWLSKSA